MTRRVKLSILVDEELVKRLREVAVRKYGKLRGGLMFAVEEALREYVEKQGK